MRLWLLRPLGYDGDRWDQKGTPWHPWYDKAFGFVVRASSEDAARVFADAQQGCEGDVGYVRDKAHPWLDRTLSSCVPLTGSGSEGVVIRDFAAA